MAQFEIKDGEPSFPREQQKLATMLLMIVARLRVL